MKINIWKVLGNIVKLLVAIENLQTLVTERFAGSTDEKELAIVTLADEIARLSGARRIPFVISPR